MSVSVSFKSARNSNFTKFSVPVTCGHDGRFFVDGSAIRRVLPFFSMTSCLSDNGHAYNRRE